LRTELYKFSILDWTPWSPQLPVWPCHCTWTLAEDTSCLLWILKQSWKMETLLAVFMREVWP